MAAARPTGLSRAHRPTLFRSGRGAAFLKQCVVALTLLLALLAMPAAAQTFPKFTGLVVDAANILPPQAEADLTQKLDALQRDTKRQLVVATIPSLEGYPIEEYGYKLGRAWGVGLKDVNNGAILLVAPNDRKVRVEVGRGLEPIITDAFSSVTINQTVLPLFKAGDMPGGITAGADAIIAQLRASPEEAQARLDAAVKDFDASHKRQRSGGGGFPVGLVIFGMVALFVFLSIARRRGGGGRRYHDGDSGVMPIVLWSIADEIARSATRGSWGGGGGGSWGGGGSSGGGWGDGGFSGGGGGDFGGGGASGDW